MPRTPRHQSSPPQMRQRSLRLPADTLERLDRLAEERGQSANTVAARLIEEGLRLERHPLIYFREGAAGRRPALLGTRLDVGQIIDTVRGHEGSVAEAAAYLAQAEPKIRAAVRYYAEFADEVDAWSQRMREFSEREEKAFRAEASLA
jgi:predicted transcriptional regulator